MVDVHRDGLESCGIREGEQGERVGPSRAPDDDGRVDSVEPDETHKDVVNVDRVDPAHHLMVRADR